MKRSYFKGKFIVIEGLDGAGTTTQSRRVATKLQSDHNRTVHLTYEPSNGPIGIQIRSVLTGRISVPPLTLAAMFAADRLDHLFGNGKIVEMLSEGWWVITDRYYLSSFAYQSTQMTSEEYTWLEEIHSHCIRPDITYFLEVSVKECLRRIFSSRKSRAEFFEKEELLQKIYTQYYTGMQHLKNQGEIYQVIDGEQPVDQVTTQIVDSLVNKWG